MTIKENNDLKEDSAALDSLKPNSNPADNSNALSKSKVKVLADVMHLVSNLEKSDLTDFFDKVMSQYGPNKDYGVSDNSEKNKSTIKAKSSNAVGISGPLEKTPMPKISVKEDVEEMFNGEDLSEDFKEKTATLFEAAVNARVILENVKLAEDYEEKYTNEIKTFTENVVNKLNTQLDYVVEQWMKENEVAIESTLRNELAEEFITGLKGLFAEHYISVPEEKVDVLEALADKVNDLEKQLVESIQENSNLKGLVLENKKTDIIETVASDLTLPQKEKLHTLAEGIEFDGNIERYTKKMLVIKEKYFNKPSVNSTNLEEETFEGVETQKETSIDPSVNLYLKAINNKKQ